MAYHISEESLRKALKHLCRYGDTDVFPHAPELSCFYDRQDEVVTELGKLDLDSYTPEGAIEALAPKSRHGFRIAHQFSATDNLLFLACIVEIGDVIEKKRLSIDSNSAFSYRFEPGPNGQIFASSNTFRDWMEMLLGLVSDNDDISTVVLTDISDFYSRILFHRLENLLDECAPKHGANRYIRKQISIIRAKQSFGLPVGGSAARLLAELALSDVDNALADQGFVATRFVDDFRIFLGPNESAYDALGFLAEHLAINEGLSLNSAKTHVITSSLFAERLKQEISDVGSEAEGEALAVLAAALYLDEDPDPEDLEKLKNVNLIGSLEAELSKDQWDIGRIKVIFRALKIAQPPEAIPFIVENFTNLTIFAKELCLLMQELERDNHHCFNNLLDVIVDCVRKPPASSVQAIRSWMLEIFVRDIISIPISKIKLIDELSSPLHRRQLFLIRGRSKDLNFFRKMKTQAHSISAFERTCLVWGAACLPEDEFQKWTDSMKPLFKQPCGQLFLAWTKSSKAKLMVRLSSGIEDHPD
jgi:hypothetical protein